MCPYDSVFEIFEQITQHILFLGTSPRKRMQFLAALESSKRELTEMPYIRFELYENSLQIVFDKGISCLLKQLSYLFVFCFMHGIN